MAHSLLKLKRTCSTDRDRHALAAQTRPPTLTDGLRDASTIKLIHLESLTVTSRRKPAAGSRCSLRRADSSALWRASRGLSVWPSPFLITPESTEQLLLFHICVSINQACEGAYVKQTGKYGRPSPSPPFLSFSLVWFLCASQVQTNVYENSRFCIKLSATLWYSILLPFPLPTDIAQLVLSFFENKAWPCG